MQWCLAQAAIAGLDPAIHPLTNKHFGRFQETMDPRVKPAGDASVCRSRVALLMAPLRKRRSAPNQTCTPRNMDAN